MLQEVLSLNQMLTDADEGLNQICAVLTMTIYTFSTYKTVSIVQPIISWKNPSCLLLSANPHYEIISSVLTTWKTRIQSLYLKKKNQVVLHASTAFFFLCMWNFNAEPILNAPTTIRLLETQLAFWSGRLCIAAARIAVFVLWSYCKTVRGSSPLGDWKDHIEPLKVTVCYKWHDTKFHNRQLLCELFPWPGTCSIIRHT